jgi:uncharacterized protein YbaA (DUF1428 family)
MADITFKEVVIWGGLFFVVGVAANLTVKYAWNAYLNKKKEDAATMKLMAVRAAQIRKGNSYTMAHSPRIIEGDRRY